MKISTHNIRRSSGAVGIAMLSLLVPSLAAAVVLDGMNQCTVKLSDGTDVVLYGEFVSKFGRRGDSPGEEVGIPPLSSYRARGFYDADDVTSRSPKSERDRANVGKIGGKDSKDALRDSALAASKKYSSVKDGGFREHIMSPRYHYLPPGNSLRLSRRDDGNPEFLFVKYTTDETEAAGGVQGGLLHFLMEWSLSTDQEAELRKKVKKDCKVGKEAGELVSNVSLREADEDGGSFRIISATLSDSGFARSMVQSGHAPTTPGGKVAAAANLSPQGAALFLSTLESKDSIADLSVELDFDYTVQLPAAKGEIIFNWDKVQIAAESYQAEAFSENKANGKWDGDDNDLTVTEDEVSAFFDYMVETSVVEFVFEGYNPDSEYTGKVMEAMMQYFLNSMMQPANDANMRMPDDDDDEQGGDEKIRENLGTAGEFLYQVNRESWKEKYEKKTQVIRMDAGLAVRRQVQVVGNMASWYNSVKGKKCCIQSVNLSDPFFKQRELRFILDQDAVDIFGEMVNYVTINVKKRRNKGKEFNESATIDAEHLDKKGIVASMTYAREDDKNSEMYEYQTQWSVRGGNLFPSRPRWLRGTWEGVTLAPPIEGWHVEAEGDLAQMEANDIARVTVELHYPLFGEEKFTVIPLSPRAGEDLVSTKIYVDKGTRGFAYRLIVHHKTEGRMVLPWETRVGDRYVYATLPEDILAAGQPQEQAKLAAQKLGKMGAEKVLNKFQELFADAE